MSVTFGLPILVWFPSNPWFIGQYPWFLLQDISSVCHCWFSPSVALEITRKVRKLGGKGGVTWVAKIVRGYAHGIIMAHYLLCQPKAQFQVPLRLPVLQRTWELISSDFSWVWPCDCNYNPTFNPALHMQNGFIHFCCHESTQICKYNQGLPPYHAINRKKKRRKNSFLVSVLTLIILLDFFPPNQEHYHLIKPVGIRVSISKSNIDHGIWLYVL